MTPEYRDVIVAAIVFAGAVVSEIGRRQAKKATDAAQLAADRSEPTGNGFAGKVTASLERIEARTERTESRCDRIASRQDRLERMIYDHLNGPT